MGGSQGWRRPGCRRWEGLCGGRGGGHGARPSTPPPRTPRRTPGEGPAMLPVIGEEVEVIARNAEGAREARGPKAHQGPADIAERELGLRLRRIDQARVIARGAYGAGPDVVEMTIETNGIEDIVGRPMLVAAFAES